MASILIDMVARQPFTHEGRSYVPGECFQCPPIHAAALRYQHKAEFAKPKQAGAMAEAIDPSLVGVRVKRRYRRRDLQAEE